ncbi:glutathione S-transferase family protein [Tepidicaulis sp. LMO-SS28]|uniref:glutathione S-transferase family protein n=1 Tax=Tepidicaulis sp. LMO-SS28 TaxID=3447455 RepID=UPI003EDFB6C5
MARHPMIDLYGFSTEVPGVPDPSAFVVKLETALRLAGVPYRRHSLDDPSKGPKGKLPYITCGEEIVADSTLIMDWLKERRGIDLDWHLTPEQRAQSHALQRMIEERLYWALTYTRWCEPANEWLEKDLFFGGIPQPLRFFIYRSVLKQTKATLAAHGIGRHSGEEIYRLAIRDIDAIAATLGEKPFLFGERVSLADATAFGILVNIIGIPDIKSPLIDAMREHENLIAYTDRMLKLFTEQAPEMKAAA